MAKYFKMAEMLRSSEAERRGIHNFPSVEEACNLQKLMDDILDPIREEFGQPIIISSGYRCEELNKAVGGVKTSWHMRGLAADMQVLKNAKYSPKEVLTKLFKTIMKMKNLPFERVLFERNLKGTRWIHIQYDPEYAKHNADKRAKRIVVEDYLSER